MDAIAVLTDAAQRPIDSAAQVLDGIDQGTLHARPTEGASSIAWLVWHAARQLDVQVSALSGRPQVWTSGHWSARLGVDRSDEDFGFGDGPEQVAALRIAEPAALLDYLKAAIASLIEHLETIDEGALDDVVDTRWDPPVTRGVRLVSVIDDAVSHVGQAQYARGLVDGWSIGY